MLQTLSKALLLSSILFTCNLLMGEQFSLPVKTGTCTQADASSATTFSHKENPASLRNEDLYIGIKTVVDLYQNNQKNQLALVDVRPAEEFEKFRIPNTFNIQLHELKYKTYLKGKILVLLNSGKQYKEIEATAAHLRVSGFENVSILDGGIRKWAASVNQLDGQASASQYLNLISVKEFLAEAKHGPWLVFDLDKKVSFKTSINGELIHLPYDSLFGLNLSSKINASEPKPMSRYLFVSNNKDIYKNIVPTLEKKGVNNYHILSQTTDYIKVFQKNNKMAAYARTKNVAGCTFQ